MNKFKLLESESILDDDYPVNWDYIYIADNKIVRSDIKGTVLDLKKYLKVKEIRRYKMLEKDRESACIGDIVAPAVCIECINFKGIQCQYCEIPE